MKVENFKRFSLKMLRCKARAFPVGTATSIFHSAKKTRMRMNLDRVASGHFVLGRHVNAVILSFDPNEKQSVICESSYETYGSSRIR